MEDTNTSFAEGSSNSKKFAEGSPNAEIFVQDFCSLIELLRFSPKIFFRRAQVTAQITYNQYSLKLSFIPYSDQNPAKGCLYLVIDNSRNLNEEDEQRFSLEDVIENKENQGNLMIFENFLTNPTVRDYFKRIIPPDQ